MKHKSHSNGFSSAGNPLKQFQGRAQGRAAQGPAVWAVPHPHLLMADMCQGNRNVHSVPQAVVNGGAQS